MLVITSPKGVVISQLSPGDCFTSFAMTASVYTNQNNIFQKELRSIKKISRKVLIRKKE